MPANPITKLNQLRKELRSFDSSAEVRQMQDGRWHFYLHGNYTGTNAPDEEGCLKWAIRSLISRNIVQMME